MSDKPIRLRATVKESTGKTQHCKGTIVDGLPVPLENIPTPAWIEIVEEGDAFYLFHFNQRGETIADTWHASLSDAQSQATFEFRIAASDWIEVHNE